ncbi:uncharacterized protein LOC143256354 isoform X2 [Tachypleus tridentatus]|uniref:uncharacterized protein LOC143256354 isoform X2 n=1 Tax=Tachypleus tridentatus TaxID=6853 RepID=UPI003FD58DC1
MKFSIPRIWHEPTDHSNNCYFCMVDSSKHQAGKNASAGVFVGPQIKKILECTEFPKNLSRKEKKPWGSFVTVVRGFLGNCKAENVVELVEALVKNYSIMGCRMSLKVHILDAHLDKFKEDMGAYSEEKGSSWKCHVCGKVLATSWGYRRHINSHAGRYRWHTCITCLRSFRWKESLQRHLRAVHGIKH